MRRFGFLFALVAALLLVTACGGSAPRPQPQPQQPPAQQPAAPPPAYDVNTRYGIPQQFFVTERSGPNPYIILMDITSTTAPYQKIGSITGQLCQSGGLKLVAYTIQLNGQVFTALEINNKISDGTYVEIRQGGSISGACQFMGGSFAGSMQQEFFDPKTGKPLTNYRSYLSQNGKGAKVWTTYTFSDASGNKIAISEKQDGLTFTTFRISKCSGSCGYTSFNWTYPVAQISRQNVNVAGAQDVWLVNQGYSYYNAVPSVHLVLAAASKTFADNQKDYYGH